MRCNQSEMCLFRRVGALEDVGVGGTRKSNDALLGQGCSCTFPQDSIWPFLGRHAPLPVERGRHVAQDASGLFSD